MKLSYAITACNEHEEIIKLVTQLLNYKGENSEVVILLDTPKAPTEMVEYLELQANADHITLIESEFDNDFAQWKNLLNSQCKGEWIFQLDADEFLEPDLIVNLEDILQNNIDKDLIKEYIAIWHDESHLNRYFINNPPKKLSPSYCYPESWNLPFERKILALDKNHSELRK